MALDVDRMEELDIGMTNFDHSIDPGLADALKARPGEVKADYPGWEFHAQVWFLDGEFHARVKRYRAVVDVISRPSLEEIMEAVCEKWGYE